MSLIGKRGGGGNLHSGLQDTRSTDGKTTLMKYFAEKLAAAEPPLQQLLSEMPHALLLFNSLAVQIPLLSHSPDPIFSHSKQGTSPSAASHRRQFRWLASRVTYPLSDVRCAGGGEVGRQILGAHCRRSRK